VRSTFAYVAKDDDAIRGRNHMIVRDIMSTNMITVVADDTLSHAANMLRQYQIHHLPVVRHVQVH